MTFATEKELTMRCRPFKYTHGFNLKIGGKQFGRGTLGAGMLTSDWYFRVPLVFQADDVNLNITGFVPATIT